MKLSVMMITYNHEKFIAQALESVLAQRVNFDYEIVIGEDCSTDRTREILRSICQRYPKRIVPLLRDKNIGAMRNMEATLAACRGEYLALLEGDDYWTCPEKLQKQVDFLNSHPSSALCCHRVRFLYETGPAEVEVFPFLPARAYTIEDLLSRNFVMTCSVVLRRDLVPSLPTWFQKMKLADWPMFALAARHGTIDLMDEVMAVYRVHGESTWSSLPVVTRLEEASRMLKALDEHLDFRYTSTIQQTIARSYFDMACQARRDGARIEVGKYLLDCLLGGGWRLPGNKRAMAGLAAYTLIGSWYRIFSRGKRIKPSPVT
jgi:glycosyltransferase involved in cell wall biosynthesis